MPAARGACRDLPVAVCLGRDVCGELVQAENREWVVTNGIGGYAMGSVAGLLTRRYHGLLIAALEPPLGRTLLVTKFDLTATYRAREYALYANRFAPSVGPKPHQSTAPQEVKIPGGVRHLESFRLEGTTPVWSYRLGDSVLEKRVWMEQGVNTTYVRYELLRASGPVGLSSEVLVNCRDHHAHTTAEDLSIRIDRVERGLRLTALGKATFYILSEDGSLAPSEDLDADWLRGFELSVEAYRGLDELDDNLRAGCWTATLQPGQSATIVASTEPEASLDGTQALSRSQEREIQLLSTAIDRGSGAGDPRIRQLVLAANQFVVQRQLPNARAGTSIIAGYPWFGDWGRDTMISLPGLLLTTGRNELAKQVLRTYGHFVDRGMLPNRFPDEGDIPEYNTVDATLWYFEAIRATFAATQDKALLEELFPILLDIVHWHLTGTRHRIGIDPQDGLLFAGEDGVQLTWMDAKVDDWVVTPRIGKPVEVNALWYNALCVLADIARDLGQPSVEHQELASRVHSSFQRFWSDGLEYCFDVIDGPEGNDSRLRPNQLLAVALHHSPLDPDRQRAIVDACAASLLTPFGLRSLAPGSPGYMGQHGGERRIRDASYHQGTVWGWLIGPFLSAHLRVYGDSGATRDLLLPLLDHLQSGAVGSISEIFDGDAPHAPRGAIAQAWSVAEVLRVWESIALTD